MLNKRHMQEVLIDQGMLTTLAMWLKPMPGEHPRPHRHLSR